MKKGSGQGFARDSFQCPYCRTEHPTFVSRCSDTGQHIDPALKMEGEVLEGKYRVWRLVGKGGMGAVFQGEHLAVGRKVAIKFLLEHVAADPVMLARFQNEARVAAAIGHRNIVDILDLGESPQGVHYIVMEYLEGRDLGDIMRKSSGITVSLAVDFTIQILSALRAVHDQGIVHRDLKPENVIITKTEQRGFTIKLVDFGLSRLDVQGSDMSLTQTGTVFGTPRYMAPEQARAKRKVDHRADLYSVGVLLYRMLTGKLPFEADTYNEMIIKITTEEPVHVGEHRVPIPDGLQDIVMRAIERDPLHRFESATALFEAIRPFRSWTSEGVALSSTPPPQPILGSSGIRRGIERPPSVQRDPESESSHTYSYKASGESSANLVDVVRPHRVIPKLKLGSSAEVAEEPVHPSVRASSERGSHTYSVVRRRRAGTDPNMVDKVSSTERSAVDPGLTDSAERALREAMNSASRKGSRESVKPPTPSRRRRDSTSPWTFAEVQVASGSDIEEPDDSVSTIGWEGPTASGQKRSIPVWAMAMALAMVILIGAGGLTLFLKLRSVETRASEVEAANGNHAAKPVAEDAAPVMWEVEFRGIPEDAEIYVDGTLHPGRPIKVENRADPYVLRVVSEGHEPWEKEVAVYSDISMNVPLRVAMVEEEVEVEDGSKQAAKKNGTPKGSKGQGSKIDTVYPDPD